MADKKWWYISYHSYGAHGATIIKSEIVYCEHPLLYLANYNNVAAMFWQEVDKNLVKKLRENIKDQL